MSLLTTLLFIALTAFTLSLTLSSPVYFCTFISSTGTAAAYRLWHQGHLLTSFTIGSAAWVAWAACRWECGVPVIWIERVEDQVERVERERKEVAKKVEIVVVGLGMLMSL